MATTVRITALHPDGEPGPVGSHHVRITDEAGNQLHPLTCQIHMEGGGLVKATMTFLAQFDVVAVVEESE